MASEKYEKEFDDQVYEDEYYEENYDEEELEEDEDVADSVDSDEEKGDSYEDPEHWEMEKKIHMSFACEDCDYRWEDVIIKKKSGHLEEEDDEIDIACPMCGSMTVSQI